MEASERVTAILGASDNPQRYAYKAMERLLEKGHRVVLVNPTLGPMKNLPVVKSLSEIAQPIDTVTVYLSAKRSTALAPDLLKLKPGRVVFNPGAENPELEKTLSGANIPWLHACTLVLLATGKY
ncbi:MAG: CoA-binding protein [Treponemataceae bacterium]